MKKIVLMLALFSAMMVNAQNADQARKFLEEVSAKVESYDNMLIDFKYCL